VPPTSVEAVQVKLICVEDAAIALKLLGVVSVGVGVLAVAVVEYALRFPAASVARTRYEYEVDPVNPVSLNVVAIGVATCAKFAQGAPWHLSTLYPMTPTLSVDAVHAKLSCAGEAAVAAKFVGVVGGVVSGGGGVVEEPLEQPASAKSQLDPSKNSVVRLHRIKLASRLFISGSEKSSSRSKSEGDVSRGTETVNYI
jgi:hypothetical protein